MSGQDNTALCHGRGSWGQGPSLCMALFIFPKRPRGSLHGVGLLAVKAE